MKRYYILLMLVFLYTLGQAQVSGVISSSEDGQTLPGVSVVIKNTDIGVISDVQGNYTIDIPEDATILVFSFVGMQKQEVPIEGRTKIDIILEPSVIGLEEVVVIGFGSQLKRDLTGSIVKVETKNIADAPVSSFEGAIQGKTSGVFIEQASGKLGEAIRVRIRGSSSISASNQPLYVIDGMPITSDDQGNIDNQPTNPLSDINLNDIETMQVLKDASAAAIYGSRAANGVIIITTKRGKVGKTKINVGYSQSLVSEPANLRDMMNAEQYISIMQMAYSNVSDDGTINSPIYGGWYNTFQEMMDNRVPLWDQEYDTDWQQEAFQKGSVTKFNISASGGSENTQFYLGLNYDDQAGILLGNFMEKIGGKLSLDHKLSDKLKIGATTSLTTTSMERVENDNAFATPLQLIALPAVQPIIDPDTGELNENTIYYNGLIQHRDALNEQRVFRNLSNIYAAYSILPELTFRSEFGIDVLDQREKSFWGRETIGNGPGGYGHSIALRVVNYNLNNFVNYTKTFADIHDIDIAAGMTYQQSSRERTYLYAKGFPTDDFTNLASAAEVEDYESTWTGWSYLSYFARANYKFNDKYLVSLSGRMDGSSRFGADNRYGFFPAGSVGWIMTNEDFLSGIGVLSFLKLRASYGITGNSEIDNFASLGLYEGVNYAGETGIIPSQLQAPALKWETTAQTDIGLDFSLFENRLTGEIDYYYKKTTDLLLSRTLPATSGFEDVWENLGSLENKGFEVVLNGKILTGEFKWSSSFNIGFNKNKVLDVAGPEIMANRENISRVREGEPIGVFVMRRYAGAHPDNGTALYFINNESSLTTEDYNAAEDVVVGSPNPDFTGGFTNTFSYKNFELSTLLNFVYGNMIYNGGGGWQSDNGDWFDNKTADQINGWTLENPYSDIPQARFADGNGTRTSSRYLYDGSYLRIKNITLSYNFPSAIAKKMHMDNVRIYVAGQNLYTFTSYPGWDPEVNYLGTNRTTQTSNIIQGYDFYTAPQARTILFGIKLGF